MLALVPVASLVLVLVFLSIAYLRGGKDDMKAAADAIQKVRSTVGGGGHRAGDRRGTADDQATLRTAVIA